MSDWTQPLCDICWIDREGPGRLPVRFHLAHIRDAERCCTCGQMTRSGIFTRIDPASVPFPS